jgi:pimeloyl-ACP methyl ester carboxylesterase
VFDLTPSLRVEKLEPHLKSNCNLEWPRYALAPHAGNSPGLKIERESRYTGHALLRRLFDDLATGARACRLMTGLVLLLPVFGTGCGSFVAHRMIQAPNTYPSWLAPSAPVLLSFNESLLTNSPVRFADVGPPPARLRYRVVEPAEYHLKVISTNWIERGEVRYQFIFRTEVPTRTNTWTAAPRGTVVLLHGYGLAEFSMVPWAWCLAQEGWRCVLVDLRGHGKSTGNRIYFGLRESRDMSQLLDVLTNQGQLAHPVAVIGESYGAALALRWKTVDPRVGRVVAIAPYAVLSNAVLNICHDYASFLPRAVIRAGLKQLPVVLGVQGDDLNTTTVLARHPVSALFVSGTADDITPLTDVRSLFKEALPGSELIVVPGATHETVTYRFSELVPPVLAWLNINQTNCR